MRSLYWLVRPPLKAGSRAYALEQSNIESTSQALRLANRNVSNRDCDSISINRTALLSRVQVWRHTWPLHHLHLQLHQQGSCHFGGVFGVVIMLEICRSAQIQNVTVYVGIHVTSSTHAAPDHVATTTMLDCRQDTIFLVLLTRASPHMLDTI